ncbi:hypothetical protein AV530_002573 [Patagioenas fasciata monilis]|uniref:Uncharacterized protein n=1 Tax=Patagioenas fasciata monilis TaxID=372326 RepID=A0A1V4K752_PATFA|nr:hypothetical protein AV530_002573 [Patagioenas fasciata monilis]
MTEVDQDSVHVVGLGLAWNYKSKPNLGCQRYHIHPTPTTELRIPMRKMGCIRIHDRWFLVSPPVNTEVVDIVTK